MMGRMVFTMRPSLFPPSHLHLITCLTLVLCRPFLAALTQASDARDAADACNKEEYPCDSGGCVDLSHFCDGVAHCRDYSDEPPGCTVCNRTYFGFVDRTYVLEVPSTPALRSHSRGASLGFPSTFGTGTQISDDWSGRPETDFICILTFTADGHRHGDIVQITFDKFHVGHFNVSGAEGGGKDGCSGDHVMIEEPKSVYKGGRWCGEGSGLNVYFTETDTVIVTLKATTATFGEYFDNPLRFKLKYRFLKKETAIVRYGTYRKKKYRGELVRNTACSRVFQGCRNRLCKVQSPNFPGFYPRNITCYYLIKAIAPLSPDLVPVIVLSQTNDRMMQIGQREHASRVSPEAILRQDLECINPEDYVLVYDGGAMRFPLLSKFCGTAKLKNITSSGPEMLVVFRSAASGKMNHLANLATGFEFNIHVLSMKRNPNTVNSEECEENVKSFGSTSGVINNPVYAMPSNSSCKYIFTGRRDEIVWLYFTKYNREADSRMRFSDIDCKNRLQIYDGQLDNGTVTKETLLMGEFCDEQIPPLCVRSREKGFVVRPCTHKESFLSTTPNVLITQEFTQSTSLKPLEYIIHYEFVNIKETGLSLFNSSCDLSFHSSHSTKGHITAPKSIFYYGRGGRKNLLCKYKFYAKQDEAIELNIVSIKFPDRLCKTVYNGETEIYDCIARITGSAILEAFENYWNNTRLILGCICDNRLKQVNLKSFSNYLELDFIIRQMTWSQDYSDFSFEAEYKFVPIKNCTEQRIYKGTNGVLLLKSSDVESYCQNVPLKISAKHTHHIYLNIHGYHVSSQRCRTNNRIVIYDAGTGRPIKAICPSENGKDSIDVFSSGWSSRLDWPRGEAVSIVFKYLSREAGTYKLKWLEVTREPRPSALESLHGGGGGGGGWKDSQSSSCGTECPEITACISPELWCDGVPHCPSGADEEKNCFYAAVPWMYVVLITVSLLGLLFGSIVILIAVKVYQKGKIKRKKKKEAQRLMTQEVLLPMTYHKENIDNIYLRGGGI